MTNNIKNYRSLIQSFAKANDVKEVMEAVECAICHAYDLGRAGEFLYPSETEKTEGTMQEEYESKQKQVYDTIEEDIDSPKIDNPSHYQSYNPKINIDCITAMRAAFGDEEIAIFCKLNAFKYCWRADSKGQKTDIGKAIWYLNKYLELAT